MPGVVFCRVWTQAGLAWPKAGKRPRPYDFRHRLAFANIERWARDGMDVMAMLPYLAAYMGHAGSAATSVSGISTGRAWAGGSNGCGPDADTRTAPSC